MIYNSQYQLNGAQLGKWKIKKALKKTFKAVKKTTGKVATAATSVAMRAYGVAPQQQQASSAESYPQASQSSGGSAPMVSYGAPGATQQQQSSGNFLDDVINEMYPQEKPAKVSAGAPAKKQAAPTGKQTGNTASGGNSSMIPILALAGAALFMMKGKKK